MQQNFRPNRLAIPENQGRSVPLTIGEAASSSGPRIGGHSPVLVAPASSDFCYFGTLPFAIEPMLDVSIFGDFENDAWFDLPVLLQVDGLVEFVLHDPAERGSEGRRCLPEHPLVLGVAQPDAGEDGVYANHKLGGTPYLLQDDELAEPFAELTQQGFRHFCQFEFPGHRDALVDGDWPFGDAIFHAFFRWIDAPEWRWIAGHR